jgi:hypothetical protein
MTTFYQTTPHHVPQGSSIHIHGLEKLKYQSNKFIIIYRYMYICMWHFVLVF